MAKATTTPEGAVLSAICEYLSYNKNILWWRSNNVPVYDLSIGRYRSMPKHTMKGLPDICVIDEGEFIGIECKSPTGRQSVDQVEFEKRCVEHGARYVVARSVEDVQAIGL